MSFRANSYTRRIMDGEINLPVMFVHKYIHITYIPDDASISIQSYFIRVGEHSLVPSYRIVA